MQSKLQNVHILVRRQFQEGKYEERSRDVGAAALSTSRARQGAKTSGHVNRCCLHLESLCALNLERRRDVHMFCSRHYHRTFTYPRL